jgi:hypothetical protein
MANNGITNGPVSMAELEDIKQRAQRADIRNKFGKDAAEAFDKCGLQPPKDTWVTETGFNPQLAIYEIHVGQCLNPMPPMTDAILKRVENDVDRTGIQVNIKNSIMKFKNLSEIIRDIEKMRIEGEERN